jgi:hypothetical protein
MMVRMIMSGGQTGADQGGWDAAKRLGLKTKGWMPRGFRTDAGPRPEFKEQFGAMEHPSAEYPPRTRNNVVDSNGTVAFGNMRSSGCKLTAKFCKDFHKPFYPIAWERGVEISAETKADFRKWLVDNRIAVLNVAGNREKKNPGIFQAVSDFLVEALRDDSAPVTGEGSV